MLLSGTRSTTWLLHFPSPREAAVFGDSDRMRGEARTTAAREGRRASRERRPAAVAPTRRLRALCQLGTERLQAAILSARRTGWLDGYFPHLAFVAQLLVPATYLKRQRTALPAARETREML